MNLTERVSKLCDMHCQFICPKDKFFIETAEAIVGLVVNSKCNQFDLGSIEEWEAVVRRVGKLRLE